MTQVLSNFIKALRAHDLRVSTAETIDAAAALATVGYDNRNLMRVALAQVLAKTIDDKARFDDCFDRFFHFEDIAVVGNSGTETAEPGDLPPPEMAVGSGTADSPLVSLLESGDNAALEQQLAAASRQVQLQNIRLFTQRGMYIRRILEIVGIEALEDQLHVLVRADEHDPRLERLRELRARLLDNVTAVVDRQMLLYTANAWPSLREEILSKTPLARLEMRDFKVMQELVRKLAKRLVALHARRRRVAHRGQLDIRHTIRRNIEYDGLLFDLVWKRVRVERPKVIAVCDVSGSVAQVARFLLLFLYSMTEVIPKVRAFAFSNQLGEVTRLFETQPVEAAVQTTLKTWGMGSTDYGGAFAELERLTLADIDQRTTVLILGDARSNYGDPGERSLRRIHERARRVLWLNPEPRAFWNSGDSAMRTLSTACDRVEPCRSLKHLERIVSEIARTAV